MSHQRVSGFQEKGADLRGDPGNFRGSPGNFRGIKSEKQLLGCYFFLFTLHYVKKNLERNYICDAFHCGYINLVFRTSSLNELSCGAPYQTSHSLNASPLFTENPFLLKSASSHPLPENWLLHSLKGAQTMKCKL